MCVSRCGAGGEACEYRIISGALLPAPVTVTLVHISGSFLESSELLWVTFDPKASQTGGPNGSAFPSRASDLPLESFSAKAFSDHDLKSLHNAY